MQGRSHRILVVDDELTIVNTVQAYLEKEGYTVRTAMDGRATDQVLSARQILDMRYARGEITREQYETMKQDIK